MKTNAINWFEIFVSDMPRAQAFYETILAAKLQDPESDCGEMRIFPYDNMKGVGGALTKMEECKPGPGGTMIYLNVEGDLDGVLSRIPAAGGKVVRERMPIPPHGFIGIFEDTEGNIVGLHSMV
ncbi:MAG: VOC family protein [Prosthecobacter sp.]